MAARGGLDEGRGAAVIDGGGQRGKIMDWNDPRSSSEPLSDSDLNLELDPGSLLTSTTLGVSLRVSQRNQENQ